MKIYYSKKFIRDYKSLSLNIKKKFEKKEKIFEKDPFDKKLKTHKLSDRLKIFWAFSIDYKYRIIFELVDKNTALLHLVGDHSIYKLRYE